MPLDLDREREAEDLDDDAAPGPPRSPAPRAILLEGRAGSPRTACPSIVAIELAVSPMSGLTILVPGSAA